MSAAINQIVSTNTERKYIHKWSKKDFKILFAICRAYPLPYDDEHDEQLLLERTNIRVSELLKIFERNRENGLRMMIEKYEHLSSPNRPRPFFQRVSRKMQQAWIEYNL